MNITPFQSSLLILLITGTLTHYAKAETWTMPGTNITLTYQIDGQPAKATITDCTNYSYGYELSIPEDFNGVTVSGIARRAFANYYGSNIILPDSLLTIGDEAFINCDNLTKIIIPKNVSSIGYGVFAYCYQLKEIVVHPENSAYSHLNGVLFDITKNVLIQYPTGKQDQDYSIPDSVTRIGNRAFAGCYYITDMFIPDNVTSIGEGALADCYQLQHFALEAVHTAFTVQNGVLFNKSQSELIQYPAGKTGNSYTIPSTVTVIGNDVFSGCQNLRTITIPGSVTSIGIRAFTGCSSLQNISVDASNNTYSSHNFVLLNKSQSIMLRYPEGRKGSSYRLPGTVTRIEDRAFEACTELRSIIVTNGVTSIGEHVFTNSYNLQEFVVDTGNSVYSSIDGILYNKEQTKLIQYPKGKYPNNNSYSIPASVTSIGEFAFTSCQSLYSITIPGSVIDIGDYAFYDCQNLSNAFFEGNAPISFGHFVFTDTSNSFTITYLATYTGFTSPTWNDYPTTRFFTTGTYGDLTYKDFLAYVTITQCNQSISTLTIPEFINNLPVIGIDDNAFNHCSLVAISIPNSVITLGNKAFASCKQLTHIDIPSSVTTIGNSAFSACDRLSSISLHDGLERIGEYAFYYCISLSSIEIPNSVIHIDSYAFAQCSALTSIELPDSVVDLGNGIFSECTRLENISISKNISSIGDYTFDGCRTLTGIDIPYGVSRIGYKAFHFCNNLATVTIPETVLEIGHEAFYGCTRLTEIIIPEGVTTLGYATFAFCIELTTVIIPDSVTSIGNNAFEYCSSLTYIRIPPSVKTLGSRSFSFCKNMSSIDIPAAITRIEDYTFLDCQNLININIPDAVTIIGTSAFQNCSQLSSVTIPASVQKVLGYAFKNCTNLQSITFVGNAPELGNSIFTGVSPKFTIYYNPVATGFSTPKWTTNQQTHPCFPTKTHTWEGDWAWNDLFGYFYTGNKPFFYTYSTYEWLYMAPANSEYDGIFFWRFLSAHWGWSHPDYYPWYYSYDNHDWRRMGSS